MAAFRAAHAGETPVELPTPEEAAELALFTIEESVVIGISPDEAVAADAVVGLDTCLADEVDDVLNRQDGTER